MLDRMVAVWAVDAGFSRAARHRERKVRTPQSSVPDNVREGELQLTLRKVPQRIYRPRRKPEVRVKRCGKSAPLAQQCTRHGKPHAEQDQIGKELEMAQAVFNASLLEAPNFRVGRLSRSAMTG